MAIKTIIRMYNQLDLGDCFLMSFENGSKKKFIMIDFGSYLSGNQEREREIARHIKKIVGRHHLTIVLTHQHKDHLSGFLSAGDILKGTANDRCVWLSYLDNESSKEGMAIRSMTEKYWNKTKKTKELIDKKYPGVEKVKKMLEEKAGFDLFATSQIGGDAVAKLLEVVDNNIVFLNQGECFPLPGMEGEVNVYVLGPPSDITFLTKLNPGKSEEVNGLSPLMEVANMDISATLMLDALENIDDSVKSRGNDFPFDRSYIDDDPSNQIKHFYENEDWRRIDYDWLSEIGKLSLHMDRLTNNTSLVLAFELVTSKKVLLFVGDAQIGNWQSWEKIRFKGSEVTANDLLSRTVFYKAGHHSSHNATLKQGLDLMNEKELIIMIPVNEKVSTDNKFAMLRPEMLKGYNRKSQGRVLRSDTVEQGGNDFATKYKFKTRDEFNDMVRVFPEGTVPHLGIELIIDENGKNKTSRNVVVTKSPSKTKKSE